MRTFMLDCTCFQTVNSVREQKKTESVVVTGAETNKLQVRFQQTFLSNRNKKQLSCSVFFADDNTVVHQMTL